jgi:Mg2+/Co2+ transporter CorB
MEGHIGSIGIIVACLIMSGYFSATETAFTSLNRVRMKNLAGAGDARAKKVLALEEIVSEEAKRCMDLRTS